jgi:hypothetical protein
LVDECDLEAFVLVDADAYGKHLKIKNKID